MEIWVKLSMCLYKRNSYINCSLLMILHDATREGRRSGFFPLDSPTALLLYSVVKSLYHQSFPINVVGLFVRVSVASPFFKSEADNSRTKSFRRIEISKRYLQKNHAFRLRSDLVSNYML